MAVEIERKFLVKGSFKKFSENSVKIVQGYLSLVPERNVRVRLQDEKAYLTVKGIGSKSKIRRFEWEIEIAAEDAKELLTICEGSLIQKTRYFVPEESGMVFEVDVFEGDNMGLVICEIELPHENYKFVKPEWLGEEISGVVKYYNSALVKNPFNQW